MDQTSRVLTILLTDIRGFTDRTSRSSRSGVVDLIERHKQLVLPALTKRGGRLVKTIGDAFLVVFDSPTDAVLAGVETQRELTRDNAGKPDAERIEVRIAINMGEVTLMDDDVYGDAVNVASRVEAVAEPGEVFFTEAVYLAMNKAEVSSIEIGPMQFKGVPEKVRVFKVPREAATNARRAGNWLWLAPVAAAILLAWRLARRAEPSRALASVVPTSVASALARPQRPPDSWDPEAVDARLVDAVNSVCGDDRRRFCVDAGYGRGRRINCLWRHWDELSFACQSAAGPLMQAAAPRR